SDTSCPGLSARRRPGSSSTSPASTDAAARERDGNMPLSDSRVSRRTRFIRGERYVIEITECAPLVSHHKVVTYLRRQVSLPAHGAIEVLLGMCLNLGTRYVEGA